MVLISFKEWRGKDRNDQNHGKSGFVGGNPRFGKQNKQTYSGDSRKRRSVMKQQDRKTNFGQKEE